MKRIIIIGLGFHSIRLNDINSVTNSDEELIPMEHVPRFIYKPSNTTLLTNRPSCNPNARGNENKSRKQRNPKRK